IVPQFAFFKGCSRTYFSYFSSDGRELIERVLLPEHLNILHSKLHHSQSWEPKTSSVCSASRVEMPDALSFSMRCRCSAIRRFVSATRRIACSSLVSFSVITRKERTKSPFEALFAKINANPSDRF